MSLLTKMLNQTAVYWAPDSVDRYSEFGKPQHASPVEISCRWEEVAEEMLLPDGNRMVSKYKVYVNTDLEIGGVLMLGGLSDVEEGKEPLEHDGAFEIKSFTKNPNLRATEFLRVAAG